MRRKRSRLAGAVLLASLASGCPSPGGPDEVADRIGPRAFDAGYEMPRPPMVQLGDEARPVVRAPVREAVVESGGVPVRSGVARLDVELPASLVERGERAFELSVHPLPFDVPLDEKTVESFRAKTRFERRDSGWRFVRGGDAAAAIEIDEPEAKQLLVRLEAIGASPIRLESEEVHFEDGGVLEVGYGALVASREGEYVFRASLVCADREAGAFEETVDAADAGTWRTARLEIDPGARSCRLALVAAREDGTPVPGAVWAVPRLLARAPGPRSDAPQGIVLISLDTLRADHVSGFGYARETTPEIDRELIAKGTSFVDATAPFPRTDVSHLSLMTSIYPGAQPVRGRLAPGSPVPTLAERLQARGYETLAFAEGGLFGGPYGFWHGYDRFTEFPYDSTERGVGVFEEGAATLEELRDRRFFLTLHTYKTHDPWTYGEEAARLFTDPAEWTSGALDERIPDEQRANVDAYDRTIREADAMVGAFLDALDESGLADRTLIVLLSDHGEAFGEHVMTSHGYGFGQEQLHVPVVLRGPGVPAGLRIGTPISLVDVAPTLLEIAGAEPLAGGQGVSLAPALSGEDLPGDRPIFFAWIQPGASGYRRGEAKVARATGMSVVYDLEEDPLETERHRVSPLPEAERAVLDAHLAEAARRRREIEAATVEAAAPEPITEKMKESLEALGYVE